MFVNAEGSTCTFDDDISSLNFYSKSSILDNDILICNSLSLNKSRNTDCECSNREFELQRESIGGSIADASFSPPSQTLNSSSE